MYATSTFQKLRRFILLFAILCALIPVPTLRAGVVGDIQILEQQVEKLPIKPKLEKNKKVKKKQKWQKRSPPSKDFMALFLIYLFPVLMTLGAILFGIGAGLAIFGLWLTGLILFGLFNIAMLSIILGAKIKHRLSDGLGAGLLIVGLIIIAFINFIIFLGFLIWGLIIASPLIWIVGLAAFGLVIANIIVAVIKV